MNRELNLAPQTLGKNKNAAKSKNTVILVALAAGLAVSGSFGFVIGREILLKKKVEALKIELSASKLKVDKKNTLDKQITLTKQQIVKASTLKDIKSNDTDALLKEFRKLVLIDGVTIETMDYTGKAVEGSENEVKVDCIASSKESLDIVWANLRENEKFKNSYISGWEKDDSGYTFDVKVSLEGGTTDGDK